MHPCHDQVGARTRDWVKHHYWLRTFFFVSGEGRRKRVDLLSDGHQALGGDFLGDLLGLIEARGHLSVDLVDAAAADRVVRMVFQQ